MRLTGDFWRVIDNSFQPGKNTQVMHRGGWVGDSQPNIQGHGVNRGMRKAGNPTNAL